MRTPLRVALTTIVVMNTAWLSGATRVLAEDTEGRPVLDQAVMTREADEEAAAKAREAEANEVKANADAAQAQAATEEAKEAAKELAAGRAAEVTVTPRDGAQLTDALAAKLGVSRAQATGGAGAIFRDAQMRLDAADFGRIVAATPGVELFLAAAPGEAPAPTGDFGGVADLTDPFAKLGMHADMVGKFLPIVLRYVQENGGDEPMQLLAGAFK